MSELASLWSIVANVPFLIILLATFFLVWGVRKYILNTWLPNFSSNRWFKTSLPVCVMGIAVGLSFIPYGDEVVWGFQLARGLIAGGCVLIGYGFARNWVREKMKALK